MANVILPFVASCGTPNVPATNLVTADNGPFTKEKDSGIVSKRQKPLQLFVEIITKDRSEIYTKDRSPRISDACSGAGSCALACSTLEQKCIILEIIHWSKHDLL